VARGHAKCALVIGAETMTRLMDWSDRGTCVLFGDGAGAVVLEPQGRRGDHGRPGHAGLRPARDGTKQDLLYVDGGVSTTGTVGKLRMLGNQVFKHAVINISEAIHAAAANAGVAVADVDWFIPHQANQRILAGVAHRCGIDEDKVISTVAIHANTSAASIPLAFAHGVKDGRIKKGDLAAAGSHGRRPDLGRLRLRLCAATGNRHPLSAQPACAVLPPGMNS
jgi:3-oxoacyl-[acyl-carrier-protein] synthase-3